LKDELESNLNNILLTACWGEVLYKSSGDKEENIDFIYKRKEEKRDT
jgi:hypothetical protein